MVDLCNVSKGEKEEKEKEKKERMNLLLRPSAGVVGFASLPLQWFVRSSFHDNTEYQMPVIRRVVVIEARRGRTQGEAQLTRTAT